MIKIEHYKAKHAEATGDYKLAYDIVNTLERGESTQVTVEAVKRFRRYLYDLAYKQNKEYGTRRVKGLTNTLNVTFMNTIHTHLSQ